MGSMCLKLQNIDSLVFQPSSFRCELLVSGSKTSQIQKEKCSYSVGDSTHWLYTNFLASIVYKLKVCIMSEHVLGELGCCSIRNYELPDVSNRYKRLYNVSHKAGQRFPQTTPGGKMTTGACGT